jgi:CubicO group peptidase (beta-lactamase class C family)
MPAPMSRSCVRRSRLYRHAYTIALAAAVSLLIPACRPSEAKPAAARAIDPVALKDTVDKLARELLVPGAVVILHTPQGQFTHRYGVTTYRGTVPTRPDQHVRVGSNTKTWTGTVILQLVQEGKLELNDPVSKYRPDVPNGARITIEQLLNMRSGLYNYSESLEINQAMDRQPQKVWKPEELLAISFKHPPLFAPGTRFSYSNTNYILLGLIAEKLEGKPLADIMRERLFQPLGLKNTIYPPITSTALPEPYTHGYMYGNNVITLKNPALPDSMQAAARARKIAPVDHTDDSASWTGAAGMGISTAQDLVKWAQALVSGKLLNADLQKRRLASVQPINPDDPESPAYGWGIARFGGLYGHTGEMPGYNTFTGHDPVKGITLVVWTNLAPAVDGRDPASTIAKALIDVIYAPAAL